VTSAAAPDLTGTGVAIAALLVFALAYAFVIAEEFTNVRKSKPMVVAAGVIWVLVAIAARLYGSVDVERLLEHSLLDYAGLLLFLIAALAFVNALDEYNLFAALRSWMVAKGFSLRSIFWLSGLLAFAISPVLDNLTTALVMGAVVLSVGRGDVRFLVPACINIVIAANAGGAFSPFGDITTLMVWQKGAVKFVEFFDLFLPSLVNWVVPALCMQFAVPKGSPAAEAARVRVKSGGYTALALLVFTLVMTVIMHQYLQLPSYLGMMTGLGLLMLHGYAVRRHEGHVVRASDAFISTMRMEWDTLLFFYGVILCVGGIGALGYLALLSQHSYLALGPSVTNIAVGLASAVIDNIPIMFAVLSMNPDMSHGQWLLVTLTAGVGGSLLSIGSAAGVALMGQARGVYTFMAHLKWIWAVALGYAASIWVHFLVNAALF
jgi:Na+/H+ antiporter NhaD/arsenite permease-like protein